MSGYRVLALVSGGKDSCYSMIQCVAAGHRIVALANLHPVEEAVCELDSYMYQTVGHNAIRLYAEAMGGLPLFRAPIRRKSVAIHNLDYMPDEQDEVEDLYDLVAHIKDQVAIDAVCSGAILSDFQRVRVESVCSRLGLISLSFLWRRDQQELLDEMLDLGRLNSIIIKVASLGLDRRHVGQTLEQVRPHLKAAQRQFGLNVCGEGGEYETLTLDCPLFYQKIVITSSCVVLHSDDDVAPVAYLRIKDMTLEDKHLGPFPDQKAMLLAQQVRLTGPDYFVRLQPAEPRDLRPSAECDSAATALRLPSCRSAWPRSRLFAFCNLTGTGPDATQSTKEIFSLLDHLMTESGAQVADVSSVCLLLADMASFDAVNREYVKYWGNHRPPVRLCVQSVLDSPVAMSVFGFRGQAKSVMHVQSISHWAPANIGPYSQAIEVGGMVFTAGQIGLIPGSMQLADGADNQATLSMRHLERILAPFGLELDHVMLLLCFVTSEQVFEAARQVWQNDRLPFVGVVVPGLPRGALIEWQCVASLLAPSCASTPSNCIQIERMQKGGGLLVHADLDAVPDNLSAVLLHRLAAEVQDDAYEGVLYIFTKVGNDLSLADSYLSHGISVTVVPALAFQNTQTAILIAGILVPAKDLNEDK